MNENDEEQNKKMQDKKHNEKLENQVMEKDGKIGIVINNCYGGFSISERGINILTEKGFRFKKPIRIGSSSLKRTCKSLIEMLESEQSIDVSGEYASLGVEYIDKKYTEGPGFWHINEYDGLEDIVIDDSRYEMWVTLRSLDQMHDKIKQIIGSDVPENEKYSEIRAIYQKTSTVIETCTQLVEY